MAPVPSARPANGSPRVPRRPPRGRRQGGGERRAAEAGAAGHGRRRQRREREAAEPAREAYDHPSLYGKHLEIGCAVDRPPRRDVEAERGDRPSREPIPALRTTEGNATMREGFAPAGPRHRRARIDRFGAAADTGAPGARRRWQQSYRCLRRAKPGPERSGGTRPHPLLILSTTSPATRRRHS